MSILNIYQGKGERHRWELPSPPPWRKFEGGIPEYPEADLEKRECEAIEHDEERGKRFEARQKEVDLINTALLLRRPLLITGQPGSGKSSLAYSVAYELGLGRVLYWPITSRSTRQEGLYEYDAIGRLQADEQEKDIGQFIRLGPLGTALLPTEKPRVLLIDEIDKSDIDLPNDLLHVFEEGSFHIQELVRYAEKNKDGKTVMVYPWDRIKATVPIENGLVQCREFPFVVMTSNDERVFPPAFLRRCISLHMDLPDEDMLARIVKRQLESNDISTVVTDMITKFVKKRDGGEDIIATDQLLNAIYLKMGKVEKQEIYDAVMRPLNRG